MSSSSKRTTTFCISPVLHSLFSDKTLWEGKSMSETLKKFMHHYSNIGNNFWKNFSDFDEIDAEGNTERFVFYTYNDIYPSFKSKCILGGEVMAKEVVKFMTIYVNLGEQTWENLPNLS